MVPSLMAVGFVAVLRSSGVEVPIGTVITYARALAKVGLESRSGVYWGGRATLVHRFEDIDSYDRAFAAFWEHREDPTLESTPGRQHRIQLNEVEVPADPAEPVSDEVAEHFSIRYSAQEVLRRKDFADLSPEERAEGHRLLSRIRVEGSERQTRRWRTGDRTGRRPDIRTMIAVAVRNRGELIERRGLARATRARNVVLLIDISGSMDLYARELVRFAHAAVISGGRVEAFALGTRLTRLTRHLGSRDPDVAISAAARSVPDWSGGTRLGEGLRSFNDRYGIRGLARGAIVVVVSDGFDRGDPELLAGELARLRRVAHRIIWVNPLKASPGYEPLARGMAAALPYVDDFVAGHSLVDLVELARLIRK
jgi:uncharacterized protein with von Willebrand factor type A (vWA) domain